MGCQLSFFFLLSQKIPHLEGRIDRRILEGNPETYGSGQIIETSAEVAPNGGLGWEPPSVQIPTPPKPRKKPSYFPVYWLIWLFNREPGILIMVYYDPHIPGQYNPLYTYTTKALSIAYGHVTRQHQGSSCPRHADSSCFCGRRWSLEQTAWTHVPGSKLPLFPYNRGWSSTQ